ncbi:MAG: sugar phosphate isomerase/epimerase family protein [Cellulosilyticaceae bacterium]
MSKVALQLYTLREECSKDFLGTLKKVAELGYEGVEFAGFFGVPALELKQCLEQLGLEVVASHMPLEDLKYRIDEVIAYNEVLGNRYIICPWSEMKMAYHIDELADIFGRICEKLKEHDMILGYHNHDHELKVVGEDVLLTQFFSRLRGKIVGELDTFWVYRAGFDPVDYMKKIGHQLSFVHVKDGDSQRLAALGEGELNLPAIIEQSEKMGIKWIIVENDQPYPTGLEDAERSMAYLKTIRG